MNETLRKRLKAIVASLKNKQATRTADIRALRLALKGIRTEDVEDQALIIRFYASIRQYQPLRTALEPSKLEQLSQESPSTATGSQLKIIPRFASDPFREVANYTVKEKLKLLKRHGEELQQLVEYDYASDAGSHDEYFVTANKMVATHRYLMRLLGALPWADNKDRDGFAGHLQAIINRLEDYGWLCEAGKATGLLPLKKSDTDYDEQDFEKKLARFLNALRENNSKVPYRKPALEIKALLTKLSHFEIQDNKIILHQQNPDSTEAMSSTARTYLQCQRSSLRIATQQSHSESKQAEPKSEPAKRKCEDERVVVESKQLVEQDDASLLTFFAAAGTGKSVHKKSHKKICLEPPVTQQPKSLPKPKNEFKPYSYRRSILSVPQKHKALPVQSVDHENDTEMHIAKKH